MMTLCYSCRKPLRKTPVSIPIEPPKRMARVCTGCHDDPNFQRRKIREVAKEEKITSKRGPRQVLKQERIGPKNPASVFNSEVLPQKQSQNALSRKMSTSGIGTTGLSNSVELNHKKTVPIEILSPDNFPEMATERVEVASDPNTYNLQEMETEKVEVASDTKRHNLQEMATVKVEVVPDTKPLKIETVFPENPEDKQMQSSNEVKNDHENTREAEMSEDPKGSPKESVEESPEENKIGLSLRIPGRDIEESTNTSHHNKPDETVVKLVNGLGDWVIEDDDFYFVEVL